MKKRDSRNTKKKRKSRNGTARPNRARVDRRERRANRKRTNKQTETGWPDKQQGGRKSLPGSKGCTYQGEGRQEHTRVNNIKKQRTKMKRKLELPLTLLRRQGRQHTDRCWKQVCRLHPQWSIRVLFIRLRVKEKKKLKQRKEAFCLFYVMFLICTAVS